MPIERVSYRPKLSPTKPQPSIKESNTTLPAYQQNKGGKTGMIVLIIIILVICFVAFWLYKNNREMKERLATITEMQNQSQMAESEINNLLDKVGQLIVLPENEEPTVATITDAGALKSEQQFYRDAQDGDKVIIYMQAKKAIIYSESRNILVNVGPIYTNDAETSTPSINDNLD